MAGFVDTLVDICGGRGKRTQLRYREHNRQFDRSCRNYTHAVESRHEPPLSPYTTPTSQYVVNPAAYKRPHVLVYDEADIRARAAAIRASANKDKLLTSSPTAAGPKSTPTHQSWPDPTTADPPAPPSPAPTPVSSPTPPRSAAPERTTPSHHRTLSDDSESFAFAFDGDEDNSSTHSQWVGSDDADMPLVWPGPKEVIPNRGPHELHQKRYEWWVQHYAKIYPPKPQTTTKTSEDTNCHVQRGFKVEVESGSAMNGSASSSPDTRVDSAGPASVANDLDKLGSKAITVQSVGRLRKGSSPYQRLNNLPRVSTASSLSAQLKEPVRAKVSTRPARAPPSYPLRRQPDGYSKLVGQARGCARPAYSRPVVHFQTSQETSEDSAILSGIDSDSDDDVWQENVSISTATARRDKGKGVANPVRGHIQPHVSTPRPSSPLPTTRPQHQPRRPQQLPKASAPPSQPSLRMSERFAREVSEIAAAKRKAEQKADQKADQPKECQGGLIRKSQAKDWEFWDFRFRPEPELEAYRNRTEGWRWDYIAPVYGFSRSNNLSVVPQNSPSP